MIKKAIAVLIIILSVYWSFSALMPGKISDIDTSENSFSTQRALIHLKEISKAPHYVGIKEHGRVRNYIINALEELGLDVDIQNEYSISKWGNMTKPKNILARVEGSDNSKALMLLTHYDSSPHSSPGGSDAGSGVVTIIESLRAYLHEGNKPKNDIVILISDAEELGLNGADIFVNKHPWAKDIGLVLNFEARGSGGPSYMLIETNGGNSKMIDGFKEASPDFPVANSLAYSIYKMLPNDTDLTRFREDGDIEGFNFAFIDDHFDYHTALDTYERLDRNTLEHQGSYAMPLLKYFADDNLNNLKSDSDKLYFNMPMFKLVTYPFSWIMPMLIIAFLVFAILVYSGLQRNQLSLKEIGKGFLPLLLSVLINGVIGYFAWPVLKTLYPSYGEMLHGFTYNGHLYIGMFAFLSLAVCFYVYHKFSKPKNAANLLVAPIFLWLILCTFFAVGLKGASFFIIPVLFGLISLYVCIKRANDSIITVALLGMPLLLILSPFVKMFPVGLGLDTLVAATLLVSLIFTLLIGVFSSFNHKNRWAHAMTFIALILFISAHFKSEFNELRPKPNSLVYAQNLDDSTAVWATYDNAPDEWTKAFLSENPNDAQSLSKNTIGSKYNTSFTFSKNTDVRPVLPPQINVQEDTIIGNSRHIKVFITPQRTVHRYEVFADSSNHFNAFSINGLSVEKDDNNMVFENRWRNRLFSYYVTDDQYLELDFEVPAGQSTSLELYEASFDLLSNTLFNVSERPKTMIPKPFILNDAVILKKTITID
ncbi:M28 family peptidase [Winogradskyella sp. 3972H.M.0a.05]|uniref:M28 family peptidase n=1 Tax=Winogradskyella sp. 3972H.M.0a.05 TaxID=2950277 RepID=UPI00339AF49E